MQTLPTSATRHLPWEACYNARDLGGLPTLEGGMTRWGAVIRSDIPTRLSETGRQALLDYGVRTIIDLRGAKEALEEPSIYTTASDQVDRPRYFNLPLEDYLPEVGALIRNAASRGEVYCTILDHYPHNVAAVLRAIANAEPGGVLIHCHAGKDRTGTVSALLLRLAGVADELIIADYAESQLRLWPLWEKAIAEAGGEENADFWLKPTATPAMMQRMLDHLDAKYDGVLGYLAFAGLQSEEIGRLRARLLMTGQRSNSEQVIGNW